MYKTNSHRLLILLIALILSLSSIIVPILGQAQIASSYFDKNFGGSESDLGESLIETSDGGFLLAGTTESFGARGIDLWLIKTDAEFNMQWNKTYGGEENEMGGYVIETVDGGYALVGSTSSYGSGEVDLWLIKLESNGIVQWSQNYGGAGTERASSAIQTLDGGFVIVGTQYPSSSGNFDFLITKTDSNGVEQWSRSYGDIYWDEATSVIQTDDKGFLIAGWKYTLSSGHGANTDFWLVKTNSEGDIEWSNAYGGSGMDQASCVVQTHDGGYAVFGFSNSYGLKQYDYLLIKINDKGELQWSKTYGEPEPNMESDRGYSAIVTSDGGFALAGYSDSYGEKGDFWLIKTDSDGVVEETQTFGGDSFECANCVIEISDGEYVLFGYSGSFDEKGDFWVLRTDLTSLPTSSPEPEIFPTTLVIASIVIIAVIGIGILVYFKKLRS